VQVLIDTDIWSLALRRRSKTDLSAPETARSAQLRELISENRAKLIGPIRQEILSGIREKTQFDRLRNALRSFPDEFLISGDYEKAAECSNLCRSNGIAGSSTDFLICAVALHRGWQIFTNDPDFRTYSQVLSLRLL
jgi:predicted nucleic acid-binding protein